MKIFLWIVSIGVFCNIVSNNIVNRGEFAIHQELPNVIMQDVIHRPQESFEKFMYKTTLKAFGFVSILYTVIAGGKVISVNFNENDICFPKFHQTITPCVSLCYDY